MCSHCTGCPGTRMWLLNTGFLLKPSEWFLFAAAPHPFNHDNNWTGIAGRWWHDFHFSRQQRTHFSLLCLRSCWRTRNWSCPLQSVAFSSMLGMWLAWSRFACPKAVAEHHRSVSRVADVFCSVFLGAALTRDFGFLLRCSCALLPGVKSQGVKEI